MTGNLLKDKAHCGCGLDSCSLFGTLGRPDREGRRHVKGCSCKVCRGRSSKRTGSRRQAKATTALGVPRSSLHPGNEETLPGAVRMEVKAGAKANVVLTAYRGPESQSEAQRPIGDHRPFVAVFMPDEVPYGLVVIRTDRLAEAVAGLAEQLEMTP